MDTSWANARVKLHSQVHLGLWLKILCQKIFTMFSVEHSNYLLKERQQINSGLQVFTHTEFSFILFRIKNFSE